MLVWPLTSGNKEGEKTAGNGGKKEENTANNIFYKKGLNGSVIINVFWLFQKNTKPRSPQVISSGSSDVVRKKHKSAESPEAVAPAGARKM